MKRTLVFALLLGCGGAAPEPQGPLVDSSLGEPTLENTTWFWSDNDTAVTLSFKDGRYRRDRTIIEVTGAVSIAHVQYEEGPYRLHGEILDVIADTGSCPTSMESAKILVKPSQDRFLSTVWPEPEGEIDWYRLDAPLQYSPPIAQVINGCADHYWHWSP